MKPLSGQLSDAEREDALRRGYTMGGMILFPGVRVDRKHTINQARGINRKIEDRFDLTLESIRRHYAGEASPLSDVLARYSNYFDLFGSFRGYVDFFLLQDLVTDDYAAIKFWAPFDDFTTRALPGPSLADYLAYRTRMLEWIEARNGRIALSVLG